MTGRVKEYVAAIARELKSGVATEHSYRPCLKALLEALLPGIDAINEPAGVACGAPDMMLRTRGAVKRPVGYVETKDIGDGDLDGIGANREQFGRYRANLRNVIFTDYLDFRFWEDGEFVASVRLATLAERAASPFIAPDAELERFVELVRHFGNVAPRKITSSARLAKLMAGKARLLAQAIREALGDAVPAPADGVGRPRVAAIAQQYLTFRRMLIHDLTPESFADIYAQTIAYAFFAARLHDPTPEDFSREEAVRLIPRTNPLLRKMFIDFDMDLDDSIAWIVDDLVALFAASDVAAIMHRYDDDPIHHFYEDFLAEYDPKSRKQRGVWSTPAPVVRFIVRAVDDILERTFGLSGGLANAETTPGGGHRVQILDPALGTGTFLAEVVRRIRSKFADMMGAWPEYAASHLVPRLNGFEILMASYAMAHLKLDMMLENAQHRRFRIFLTNALEPHDPDTGTLWAAALSEEAQEANYVKRDCPVMVVVGNPPYSVSSCNKGEWIQGLVADYKKGLNERKINLDDDYIKFIRLGQHYIERNGEGVLAFITNNSFLDGITHRRMRQSLMESFDEIYVLDLHGNARKKETAPDGSKDENIFDIMQGVSINIFVRRADEDVESVKCKVESEKRRADAKPVRARVFHAEVFGTREAKYAFLDAHELATTDYRELHPAAPHFFFVPKDFALEEEYKQGFSVAELMPVNNSGIQTKRDKLAYNFTRQDIEEVVRAFRNDDVESIRKHYLLPADGRDWAVSWAKEDVSHGDGKITQVAYHPLDKRWTYFTGRSSGFMAYPRMPQSAHMLQENVAMLLVRNTRRENSYNFFVTDTIVDKDGISGFDNCRFFPLYLYGENMGKVEKTPNLNPEIVKRIASAVGDGTPTMPTCSTRSTRLDNPPTPEDIFHYIYAVLHAPQYRARYKEFLKVDFPRIPYPANGEVFRRLAAIGERLVAVHLLKDPKVRDMFAPYANFPVSGDNRIEFLRWEKSEDLRDSAIPQPPKGRIYVNSEQYIDNVPAAAWEFFVGGYQPAQKWLKDRKGRVLTSDDLLHYKSIISALVETRRLMGELAGVPLAAKLGTLV